MDPVPTVVDDLTTKIRGDILSGELRPGDRILLRELELRFGVSHIPVREALRRLESEGLVMSKARHGSFVSPLSIEELRDLYSLRIAIEPTFAKESARIAGADWIESLEEGYDRLLGTTNESRLEQLVAHRDLHLAILSPSLGATSERVVTQLWRLAERYVAFQFGQIPRRDVVASEHIPLIDAAKQRDGELLAQRLADHLQHTIDDLIPRLSTDKLPS